MFKKRPRFIFFALLPLAFLLIPFSKETSLSSHLRSLTLEPQKTGIMTLNYYDEARNRPLITEVWYPIDPATPAQTPSSLWMRCNEARDAPISTSQSTYPLILMSHGLNGDRYNISWLAEALAANGYIVAAMDHYGNTWNNKIPESSIQPWERPRDISFVLDQLLEDPLLKDRIDSKKIGFAGYSLGGATGMWIAGAQMAALDPQLIKQHAGDESGQIADEAFAKVDFTQAMKSYRDPRIHAIVVMAPALGWAFTEASLSQIDIPMMIVAPQKDDITPTEQNAKRFAKTIKKASMMILPGEASHYVFLNQASLLGKRVIDRKYCEDPSSINRKSIHKEVSKKSILFFDQHLSH